MTIQGHNLIGYQEESGSSSAIAAINPATGETLTPNWHSVSEAGLQRAADLAWQAFLQYREYSGEKRALFLEAIAEHIAALGDTLIQRAMQETGLPQARLEGERDRTCNQLRLFAGVVRDGSYQDLRHDPALPERKPLPRPELRSRKIALGPVAVFGASNFPLAFSVAGGDTASALAAGCPVIVKAHNAHPGTSELVGRAILAAARAQHMPEGIFSLLYDAGTDIGQQLAAHPHIKAIGFTGSRTGGTALMRIAQNRAEPIPVYAEMSSINPVYLMPHALQNRGEVIAQSLVAAMMMGAGQFCTSPGLILATESAALDTFIQSASRILQEQAAQTMLTPGIAQAYAAGTTRAGKHAQLLAQGQASDAPNHCRAHLYSVHGDDFNAALAEEIFGSAAIIVRCRDQAQIEAISEGLEGQLTAAIHADDADDPAILRRLIALLERKAGRILFNGYGTGVEVCDAIVHGGPYPATSDGRSTSVGSAAIERFLRPVCYQNIPPALLPEVFQAEKN